MQIYKNAQRHQQKVAAFLRLLSFSVIVYFLGQGISRDEFPAGLGVEKQSQCHWSIYFEFQHLV